MSNPILSVKHLKKYFFSKNSLFKKEKEIIKAVDDISFDLEEKKTIAIVGESGSGKTTAALSAIHLIEPTGGETLFLGKNIDFSSPKEHLYFRRHIQVVFQDPLTSLNPRKTILQSLGDPLSYHKIVKNESEKKALLSDILVKVGLSAQALDCYPHQFSGGERQRISIGRAIAIRPKIIVCDEAISALDLSNQARILNLLFDLKQEFELSYLFISHDLSTVRNFSDTVLVMLKGKIIESGETKELFKNPKHSYTKQLFNSLPKRHPRD